MFFVYDLETTGVRHWKNSIHQLSYQIRQEDGTIELERDLKIQPYHRALIESAALEVSGVTEEDLESYLPFRDGYKQVIYDLEGFIDRYNSKDKMHLLGYNSRGFDNPFFRAYFKQNGDKYFGSWFWSDSLDVLVLASQYLRSERSNLANFKLSTVAEYLGIPVEEERLHDATYDLELTWKIYQKVT